MAQGPHSSVGYCTSNNVIMFLSAAAYKMGPHTMAHLDGSIYCLWNRHSNVETMWEFKCEKWYIGKFVLDFDAPLYWQQTYICVLMCHAWFMYR